MEGGKVGPNLERSLERTGDRLSVPSTLAPGYEHDVPLTDIRISILQEKDLVNTVVLKC